MDFKKLVIGFIYKSKPSNLLVLSATFIDGEQDAASKMSKSFFINLFKNKEITVKSEIIVHAKILDVKISTSIAGYFNVDLLTDLKEQKGIAINDLIEVK